MQAKAEVLYAGKAYLYAYQKLACISLDRGEFEWKIRPKHHYFCHLLEQVESSSANPRFTQCFIDEDFVGRMAKLAKACKPQTASLRVLQRWLLMVASRWYNPG